MSKIDFGSLTFGPPTSMKPLPAGEPSHIHVPRPSRPRRPTASVVVDEAAQLETTAALDQAA